MKYCIVIFNIIMLNSCICNRSVPYHDSPTAKVDSLPLSQNLEDLFWGNIDFRDTSNYLEASMFNLNKSDYKSACILIQKSYSLHQLNIGGFSGFQFNKDYFAQAYEQYFLFRLNGFTNNIGDRALLNQLVGAIIDPKSSLYKLFYVEFLYLNSDDYEGNINYIKSLKKSNPKSLRLDYILAMEYLKSNNLDSSLKLFNILIEKDYYALPSLRNIIQYLSDNHNLILEKYLVLFNKKYPSECNLFALNKSFKKVSVDSLPLICNNCINSIFQRDSVYALVLLAQYYLSINNIEKADSMAEDYIHNLDKKTFDSTVLYEKGNYLDLKMRILFKEKKYSSLCNFINTKLEDNPIITIDNEGELRLYIQSLYIDYISSNLSIFPSFFNSNFGSCFDDPIKSQSFNRSSRECHRTLSEGDLFPTSSF